MTQYRDKLTIITKILLICQIPTTETALIRRCNLNVKSKNKFLRHLLNLNLLTKIKHTSPHQKAKPKLKITKKAEILLSHLIKIHKILEINL